MAKTKNEQFTAEELNEPITVPDPYHGVGGSYIVNRDGTRTQTEAPTRDHPEGNRARPASTEE